MKRKNYQRGTDSVPAKLTPREAVLNRNAAELLGRHNIAALNAHGNMLAYHGIDLPSDPTPGPSTENMLGYQMGTYDVGDDRGDLMRDADSTFYGGGQAPAPTPTPTPIARRYQYGTDDVDPKKRRINGAGIVQRNVSPSNPVSASRYFGRNNVDLGPQYDPTGGINPLPKGVRGIQGFPQTTAQRAFSNLNAPMTHTDMAADIARRNLTSSGSLLGTPQQNNAPLPSGVQQNISPEQAASQGFQWGGRSWLPYVSPQQMTDQNLQYTGGQPSGSVNAPSQQTVHFLPPGFTATTGSSGAPNSSQNDIHFLPPGFSSVQGRTNPMTKQLQDDQGYGSAYGY